MSDFPINSTARVYYDAEESPCTLSQMVKHEPEWAENRIREGEKAIAERDAAQAKLAAIGRLRPTDYDDREQLLCALFRILRGQMMEENDS